MTPASWPVPDRRSSPRVTGHELYLAHMAEVRALRAEIATKEEEVDRLVKENRRLRGVIHRAACAIERSFLRGRSRHVAVAAAARN